MGFNLELVCQIIREFYVEEFNTTDDKKIVDHLGMCANGCRQGFDVAGALVWDNLLKAFVLRDGEGRDEMRGEAIAFFILSFGVTFHQIQTDMRAYFFWRDVFPVISEQRRRFREMLKKYEEGGEYAKNPDTYKIMLEACDKNVNIMLSIFDNWQAFHKQVISNDVYGDLITLLHSTDSTVYEKALLGFIHMYYLINKYGIILGDEYVEELKKDADEWMLESCLGESSLRFIKSLSGRMDDAT